MKNLLCIRKVPFNNMQISKFAKKQSPFNHMTVIMKKATVIRIGNYKDVGFEDYDLWARMIVNNCNMMNVDRVFVKARTGNRMYKRRSGGGQIKKVIETEKRLLEYKIINRRLFCFNVFVRSVFALVPSKMKKFFYINCIRKISP